MGAIVKFTTRPFPEILCFPQEETFKVSKEGSQVSKFPSLSSPSSLDLSVIVPAYNEEERLSKMLEECLEFLESRSSSYEVIIVDDGSRDSTSEVGLNYVDRMGSEKVRVLTLAKNRGKGGAVRMGMLRARGENLLFADASRTIVRTILMYGFHACVWIFAVKTIKDTQCGFKLLKRKTAQLIFTTLHIERWAFDVEMLKVAEMMKIPMAEVSVRWQEIDGSKLSPLLDAIQMFRDIFFLWLRYAIGAWKLPEKLE